MKKIIILLLTIIISMYAVIYAKDNELLVLQDNVKLIVHPDTIVTIKELYKLERIKFVSPTMLRSYIRVKTEDGKNGWVLEKYTTYITDKWKEQKLDSHVTIMLSKNQTFQTMEKEFSESIIGPFVEKKLYNENYFIMFNPNKLSLQKNLEMAMQDLPWDNTKPIIKK